MLQSMTGHGAAHIHATGLSVFVEIRTVNSRYYKLSVRITEGFAALESRVDEVVRRAIRRGTVQIDVRVLRESAADQYRLNESVLAGYARQARELAERLQLETAVRLDALLLLPGVAEEQLTASADHDGCWPKIEQALVEALRDLSRMREEEGRAMAADLLDKCQTIAAELDQIEQRAPLVVEGYRQRLAERISRLLSDYQVRVEPADIVREVGLFAERSDISEEVVRLRSHLDQFRANMHSPEAEGRKLEFVTQEMFREANTIGSKANDAEIARRVIDIKASIERIREMIQNVE